MALQQIRERVANAPKSKPSYARNQLDFTHQEGNSYSAEREAEIQRLLAVQAERETQTPPFVYKTVVEVAR